MSPRYPDISVKLTGSDGNAFAILGTVRRALVKGKVPKTEVEEFMSTAMSSDYHSLLATCMEWVDVS